MLFLELSISFSTRAQSLGLSNTVSLPLGCLWDLPVSLWLPDEPHGLFIDAERNTLDPNLDSAFY